MFAEIYQPASEAELSFLTTFFYLLKKYILSCYTVTQISASLFKYSTCLP